MGPCIKQYEVGSEFVDYFPAPFLTPFGEKYLLDLVGYASSVCNYFPSCTLRDETYRSRRRGEQGRNFVGVRKLM
jgi:copper oxidase (laccase) domain-containing protein